MIILSIIFLIIFIISIMSLFFYLKHDKLYDKWFNSYFIPKQECTIIIITIDDDIYTGCFKIINNIKYFYIDEFKDSKIQWKYIKKWIYKYK